LTGYIDRKKSAGDPGNVGSGAGPDATRQADASADGRVEAAVGSVLVLATVAAALFFRRHPGPTFVDRWGFSLIHPAVHNSFYRSVTKLRSVDFLVAASILSAVVVVGRDRLRALACLLGPGLAVVLVEWLLKPVIARRYEAVLTFPSGSVTVVASVATAWVLAVPRRLRPVTVVFGAVVVVLECVSVVALQWHFPSDALGGVVFGVGVVLLVDGLLHMTAGTRRRAADR